MAMEYNSQGEPVLRVNAAISVSNITTSSSVTVLNDCLAVKNCEDNPFTVTVDSSNTNPVHVTGTVTANVTFPDSLPVTQATSPWIIQGDVSILTQNTEKVLHLILLCCIDQLCWVSQFLDFELSQS